MRYFSPSSIFDYLGGQNGRRSANIKVKNQKIAKMYNPQNEMFLKN